MSDENMLLWVVTSYVLLACIVYAIGRQAGWDQGFKEGQNDARLNEMFKQSIETLTRGPKNGESEK